MSVRQKKDLVAKVASDIMEYGLGPTTTMEEYVQAINEPTMRRAIIKTYKTWGRILIAVNNTFPRIFEGDITPAASIRPPTMPKVKEHVMVTEAKAAVKEELTGLSTLKKASKKES